MTGRITCIAFIISAVLSLDVAAQGDEPNQILFVGNSYTYFWNLPQQVSTMAESSNIQLITRQSTAGGATLRDHWHAEKKLKTREILKRGEYDAVIFQGHSMSTIETLDSLLKYGEALSRDILTADVQVYVYQTWAREWNPLMQDTIIAGYEELAERIGADVVPVGLAWQIAKEFRPDIELYDMDGSHPSTLGTYLTACVFYAKFSGRSPVGLPHRLITTDKDGEVLYLNIQSRQNAEFCQRIAEIALQQYEMN